MKRVSSQPSAVWGRQGRLLMVFCSIPSPVGLTVNKDISAAHLLMMIPCDAFYDYDVATGLDVLGAKEFPGAFAGLVENLKGLVP